MAIAPEIILYGGSIVTGIVSFASFHFHRGNYVIDENNVSIAEGDGLSAKISSMLPEPLNEAYKVISPGIDHVLVFTGVMCIVSGTIRLTAFGISRFTGGNINPMAPFYPVLAMPLSHILKDFYDVIRNDKHIGAGDAAQYFGDLLSIGCFYLGASGAAELLFS